MSKLILRGVNVILDNDGNERLIGELHDKTFVTYRNPKKHLMRKWDAYGISSQIVNSSRVETIVVIEEGVSYPISIERVKAYGRIHEEKGFESQYFIPREILKSQ